MGSAWQRGSGDNAYVRGFAGGAAGVLAAHFAGRVSQFEVWDEANAWTTLDGQGDPMGGSYVWPSSFARLLAASYAAIKAAGPDVTVVSGRPRRRPCRPAPARRRSFCDAPAPGRRRFRSPSWTAAASGRRSSGAARARSDDVARGELRETSGWATGVSPLG